MSNLLLRKLTRKSNIGFGQFKEWSVGQLLDMGKIRVLMGMYYGLEKIDFCDDLKKELCLTEKYQIEKPGKAYGIFDFRISKVLRMYYDSLDEKSMNAISVTKYKEKAKNKKDSKIRGIITENRMASKMLNKKRNQW